MSIMIRPDSGTKTRAASQRDVNKHMNELQQELIKSRTETQRAREKLNCLISLVRRSWNGDRNASIHLANIIGLDIPQSLVNDGTAGRPGSRIQTPSSKTRATVNWERMTVRLLQRDNDLMQTEIREHQQRYMENRSRFMDEVMHFHQQDMSRLPLSRPTSAKLNTLDQQFLQKHSLVKKDGKNDMRQALNRVKSASMRTQPKVPRDVVEQEEVRIRDLFVDSSRPAALPPSVAAADASLGGAKEPEPVRYKYRQDYDDTRRYTQGNLYRADESLVKKPRPVSAALLREKDRLRARPKSAVTFTMNVEDLRSEGERPLKFETTRPVSGKKPSSAKNRKPSADLPQLDLSAGPAAAPEDPDNFFIREDPFDEDLDDLAESHEPPPISVRVKNAITRPESVDKFSDDLRHMEEMERQFKMNTVTLQKKLGLPENGMV